jgi:hypothetical protein
VAAEADAGRADADEEVEQDQDADRGGKRVKPSTAGDHEGGCEDPENRARGTNRERVGVE